PSTLSCVSIDLTGRGRSRVMTITMPGAGATAEETFAVIDPATGEQVGEAPECSPARLDATFAAAAAALPAWSADEDGRREALVRIAEAIVAAGDELTALLVSESGKPSDLARLEVTAADIWLRYFAGVDIQREVLKDDATARVEIAHRPVGVVAAIT